ncbi:MAG: hypothetical protein FWH18_12305 [Marinilabiliaceae bacterium]|nr:hypothetical protein [Marinilabiliaceae bacterium]
MNLKHVFLLVLGFFLFWGCSQDPDVDVTPIPSDPEIPAVISKSVFSGYAQKGPFIIGSSVMILELDNEFNQTGRSYSTTIISNTGSFEQKNIELVSQYVELKVDGYYFNEVTGNTSNGQITLYALADIEDVSSANVNVLTHLERPRVNYLVNDGMEFSEAKRQAQQEVLALFGFEPSETYSEALHLLKDAKLLAISSILQSFQSMGDMMELMAYIGEDIKTDGKLDNIDLGTQLIDGAHSISRSLPAIRENLKEKYSELEGEFEIPDFEKYVVAFLESELYPMSIAIKYPETGDYGINILSEKVSTITIDVDNIQNVYFSMHADVPDGFSLKVVLKGGYWAFEYAPKPIINWTINTYNEVEKSQVLTVNESGSYSDVAFKPNSGIFVEETNEYYIIIEYYENGSETPTKVKNLYLEYITNE